MIHQAPDRDIYKYRNFYRGAQIIEFNELYFEDPRNFPDINDCSISLVDFSATAQDIKTKIKANGKNRQEIRTNIAFYLKERKEFSEVFRSEYSRKLDDIRISCFSSDPDIYKMWTEYADNFQGMCIQFNSRFEIDPIFPYVVTYCEPLPKYNYFKENENIIVKTISTKLKSKYSFEKEIRLFHFGRIKKITFDSRLITSVILGEKLSNENIEKIRRILKRSDLQHLTLKKAFRNNIDGISIEEI